MALKCDQCGLESEIELAFTKERRWLGLRTRQYCPSCYIERNSRRLKIDLAYIGLFGVSGWALGNLYPGSWLGGFLRNVFWFWLVCIPLILLHELSHAAVGYLLKMRIFGVTIGFGKVLFSGRVGRVNWEVRTLPFSGLTLMASPPLPSYRLRVFLSVLAGPALHALLLVPLAALSLSLALLFPYISPAASWLPSLVSLLISANVAMLVISLFPWQVQTNYGRTGSDGWKLLHTPTMPEEEQSEQLASYYIQEGLEAYKQRNYRSARAWMEKGIEKYPEQPLVLNALGFVQVGTGEFEQSRETFLALLKHQLKPELKYMVLNNIAYANLMVGDSQLLHEADAYSAEAYQNAPWMPAIAGTRGAVLVEMGRLDEGVSLLKRAMAEHTDAQGKAANACYLAIAESHRGNPEEARRYLETARALDPTCYLLPRATQQLALSRSVIF